MRSRVLEHPSASNSFLASGPANFFSSSLYKYSISHFIYLFIYPATVKEFVDEQRLRVFENKVPRKIFGAERDEIYGRIENVA